MRLIPRLTALLLCFALITCAVPFTVGALTAGDYTYDISTDGTATIKKYNGTAADLLIPDTLGGATVTAIGISAFESNMALRSVILPDELITVGSRAFYNCQNLADITIGTACYDIGTKAFHNTAWLTNAENGPVYIGRVLYSYQGTMTDGQELTVKYGTAAIAPYAFDGRALLKAIYLPVGLKTIGACAFLDCTALETVRMPSSVKSIGNLAFFNADNVTFLGVSDALADTYAEENNFLFEYDATLDYPDGDVNADNIVNSTDCRIILRVLAKAQTIDNEERYQSADISDDGKVSTADVRLHLRRIVGLE